MQREIKEFYHSLLIKSKKGHIFSLSFLLVSNLFLPSLSLALIVISILTTAKFIDFGNNFSLITTLISTATTLINSFVSFFVFNNKYKKNKKNILKLKIEKHCFDESKWIYKNILDNDQKNKLFLDRIYEIMNFKKNI
ncbi:MAG: hypothetical protein ACRCRZ_00180 [Metamycoplasmataceae bacterium]